MKEHKVRSRITEKNGELVEWLLHNDHVLQISHPRSGNAWLWTMIQYITEQYTTPLLRPDNSRPYEEYLYFCSHLPLLLEIDETYDFVVCEHSRFILLVRDPRDAILSYAYRQPNINPVLDASPVRDIGELVDSKDNFKEDSVVSEVYRAAVYRDGAERYEGHCLKWQRDPIVGAEYSGLIWDLLHDKMEPLGYTSTGHNTEKWLT